MASASRELLASRGDVWRFLAEPYHLADWWPGLRGVEPDRRGFSPGARWQVTTADQTSVLGLPRRHDFGRTVAGTLVITAIVPFERWSWQLIRRGRVRTGTLTVEIALREAAAGRTQVTIEAPGRSLAKVALGRLYDLVQTSAAL